MAEELKSKREYYLNRMKELMEAYNDLNRLNRSRYRQYEESKKAKQQVHEEMIKSYLFLRKTLGTYGIARHIGFQHEKGLYVLRRFLMKKGVIND